MCQMNHVEILLSVRYLTRLTCLIRRYKTCQMSYKTCQICQTRAGATISKITVNCWEHSSLRLLVGIGCEVICHICGSSSIVPHQERKRVWHAHAFDLIPRPATSACAWWHAQQFFRAQLAHKKVEKIVTCKRKK